MAKIPLDKDYLRKHYPDKHKELEKNKASSPASQSKDNKHCSKAETPSPIFTIGEELQDFYYGGIKQPTEFDKYIDFSKGGGPREFKISETARLAKMSGYVVKHLRRWEQEKVTGTIEHIYRAYTHPFTCRVMQIEPDCERMKPLLALRMNTIRDNFEERYKNLLLVAKKVEEKRDHDFRAAIDEFKVATILLCDTVQMIHNEAVLGIEEFLKLQGSENKEEAQREKQNGKAGGEKNKLRSLEGEWSKPMSKSKMMNALGIDSYETFNAYAKRHGIKEINRKTFQICLDKMSNTEKDKLSKA